MNELLHHLLDGSTIPVVTALLLGLLTAISPCPLATNIAAIGYIARDAQSGRRTFANGLMYTAGRIVSYAGLGCILLAVIHKGADLFGLQQGVILWGERLLAPALLVIGVLMLVGDKLRLPSFGVNTGSSSLQRLSGTWGSLLLGMLFAMAFCPSSALFYFGMLIPLSATTTAGYLLPVLFAVATSLPVIVVAWILSYSLSSLGRFYDRMRIVQKWLNLVVAIVFILVGVYYLLMNLGIV